MSAKIRLSRIGTKGKPFYRVIIIDESEKRNGKPIETIGHYDPRKEPSVFEINQEKALEWIKKGALPTETVRKLLGKIGVLPAVNFDKKKKKLPKNQAPAAPAEIASAVA